MIKCVTIDDEPLARECIVNYIKEVDFLESVGTGSSPLELEKLLAGTSIDLIFLDIQMPVINGIEYLKMTPNQPMVVIATAYPSYALESFQLDVLDYLVKPITFARFLKAAHKAKDYHRLLLTSNEIIDSPALSATIDYFFIKCANKYEKIDFDEILYVQAMQNYVTIYTQKDKYMTLLSLKSVEENLSKRSFIRVHKSYIVAIQKIEAIEDNDILMQSNRIPISRNYRDDVMARVINSRLWKK